MTDRYMCFVDGGSAPKKFHDNIETAELEACRLARLNVGMPVYVLLVCSSFIGQVDIKQIKE